MRRSRSIAIVILLLGLTASSTAWAHGGFRGGGGFHGGVHSGFHHHHRHGHFHRGASVGVVIGAPLVWPWYYPPAYYYPPVALAPVSPPVYIERQSEEAQPGTWYYCSDPQGYYPHVQQCRRAWQQVPAQVPPRQ